MEAKGPSREQANLYHTVRRHVKADNIPHCHYYKNPKFFVQKLNRLYRSFTNFSTFIRFVQIPYLDFGTAENSSEATDITSGLDYRKGQVFFSHIVYAGCEA